MLSVTRLNSPLGFKCCKLGTDGSFEVQSAGDSCFASTLSLDLFLAERSTAGLFVSDLGAPTCFTDAAGIADDPLLGGTGGLEDECRR